MQYQLQRPIKDLSSFRSSIKHELVKLYHKTKLATTSETDLETNPVSTYNDTLYFLEILYNSGIPIPEIIHTKQGNIRLKWYPEQGSAVIYVCGDGLVIYNVFVDEDLSDSGSCVLTDPNALDELLKSLRIVFPAVPFI